MQSRRMAWLLPALFVLSATGPAAEAQSSTVVVVVRHAERAPGSGDVPLSDVGRARAETLAEIGKGAGVQVIIHTQFQRTRQTAEPLAKALGLSPTVVTTQPDIAKHAAEVAAAVRQHAGKVVLVVGHSNTVPAIVAALGGSRYPDLCESEYDRLFTLVLHAAGGVTTIRTQFGAPTPVGANCATMR